jgi:protein tyrosine phosphatase (PTP) superfamily phosphohydrolase (DUF442 family)
MGIIWLGTRKKKVLGVLNSLKNAAHEFRVSFKVADLSTPQAQRRAQTYMIWFDHEFLRHPWTNQYEIAPHVYRSNQPPVKRIAQLAQMGIHSIITLRGDKPNPFYLLEAQACTQAGIELHCVTLKASRLPPASELLKLLDLFETIQRPFLFHCKSGSDRTGLAAALYLHVIEGHPIEESLDQLSLKYVHLRASRKGIHPYMLSFYAAWRAQTGGDFREFLHQSYDPDQIADCFSQEPFWRKVLWKWAF